MTAIPLPPGSSAKLARWLWPTASAVAITGFALAWWLARDLDGARALAVAVAAAGGAGALAAALAASLVARRWRAAHETLAAEARSRVAESDRRRLSLQRVVESLSDGVLVTDPEDRPTLSNRTWEDLFGEEVEDRQAPQQIRIAGLIELARQRGAQVEDELSAGEPQRPVLVTATPLSEGQGALVLARDLSGYMRAAQMRRDFVANVSHELRTPLAAIRAMAETLHDGAWEEPEHARHFSERIVAQCARLDALLRDLLALSAIEHGGDDAAREPLDLAELLRAAVATVSSLAKEKEIELGVSIGSVPELEGQPGALERMCLNLLQNAIKYNRAGGKVEVALRAEEERLVLEVSDTGIGIPGDALDRIFERFYRVDRGRSRDQGGTGLGLAIVKHAAQLHHGKIEVSSQVGGGTTFRVLLPIGNGD